MSVDQYVSPDGSEVRSEIFTSGEIYQQELKNIFARSWVFLAHDSMLPKPGDFLQNYIGEDPVVIVRQKDGSVKAFLNQCRHRGMRICRVDEGNAKSFFCSFHGWVYDTAGKLVEVPHEAEAYPQGLDKDEWSPVQVPMLHNYKGFWFGNWDQSAPSFEEYLGDMAWYFDAYIDRYDGGVEAIAVHKWVIPGNWKFNVEQPSSDMAHAEITHASAVTVLAGVPDESTPAEQTHEFQRRTVTGGQYSDPHGHGCGWFTQSSDRFAPAKAQWEEDNKEQIVDRVGQTRYSSIRGHANIFPNFMFLGNGTMRLTHPRGPGEFEMWAWTFVPVNAPAEVKEEIRNRVLRTFSPAGLFEQDDAENWLEAQRIHRGFVARSNPMLYKAQYGREREDADGWPGTTAPHVYADAGSRGLYRHYADMMSGKSWAEIEQLKAARKQAARAGQTVAVH